LAFDGLDGLEGNGDIYLYGASKGSMISMTEKWNRMKVTHGGGQRKEKRQTKRRI
jgi:hypothetical protein